MGYRHGPFCAACAQSAEGIPFAQWLDEHNGNAKTRIRPLDRNDLLPAPHHLNLLARPEPFSGRRIIGAQMEDM
jgi:hypothetical protein